MVRNDGRSRARPSLDGHTLGPDDISSHLTLPEQMPKLEPPYT